MADRGPWPATSAGSTWGQELTVQPDRRSVVAGLVALTALASTTPGAAMPRMPVLYLPHGGGPWPFVDVGFGGRQAWEPLARYLRALPASLPAAPRALLVVTAHWEAKVPTVSSHPSPDLLYDYYGFPPAAYQLTWRAPGEPALAARVRALLEQAGIPNAEDRQRGLDHGTFVPLAVSWPQGCPPVVQLSLMTGLDPARHLALGAALAPLREEGVLILGSGLSYHNLRTFGRPDARAASEAFDAWLHQAVQRPDREAALCAWSEAPFARACHPREEHLLPLHVVAGAAGSDAASLPFSEDLLGARVSAVAFG